MQICGSLLLLALLLAQAASAEVVKIEIRRRDDARTHERVIGRVHFAIDPKLPANRAIADLDLVPKNAEGMVEFTADVLFFRPKDPGRARGTVFFEVVNRGRDQSLAIMSGAQQRNLSPELRSNVRPVFKAVLKGSTDESTVYQVVWHKDIANMTDVNMRSHKIIPGDQGSLIIAHRNLSLRLDHASNKREVD